MKMKEKYINNQYNTLCLEYVEVDLFIPSPVLLLFILLIDLLGEA